MKVLVSLNFPSIGIEMLKKEGLEVTTWTEDLPMTKKQLLEASQEHEILLSSSIYKLDADFLQRNKHLKLISQFAAGYNNIDLKAASDLGIPVANTPNAMSDATADIAFGLMLAVARKMFYMHKKILSGDWGHFRPQANLGINLRERQLVSLGWEESGPNSQNDVRGLTT